MTNRINARLKTALWRQIFEDIQAVFPEQVFWDVRGTIANIIKHKVDAYDARRRYVLHKILNSNIGCCCGATYPEDWTRHLGDKRFVHIDNCPYVIAAEALGRETR